MKRTATSIGFVVAALALSCAPCTPAAGPCLLVYVRGANNHAVDDASVTFTRDDGATTSALACRLILGRTDPGCFARLGFGCTGSTLIRVTHPMFATHEQRVSAPLGREYECMQAQYRVDVALAPR